MGEFSAAAIHEGLTFRVYQNILCVSAVNRSGGIKQCPLHCAVFIPEITCREINSDRYRFLRHRPGSRCRLGWSCSLAGILRIPLFSSVSAKGCRPVPSDVCRIVFFGSRGFPFHGFPPDLPPFATFFAGFGDVDGFTACGERKSRNERDSKADGTDTRTR